MGNGGLPKHFKDANVVTIWKPKESKSDCKNYRGISLVAIAGKILGKVLLKRLTSTIIEPVLTESQCGLRANRGTTDMIFCARQIHEKSRNNIRTSTWCSLSCQHKPLVAPREIWLSI